MGFNCGDFTVSGKSVTCAEVCVNSFRISRHILIWDISINNPLRHLRRQDLTNGSDKPMRDITMTSLHSTSQNTEMKGYYCRPRESCRPLPGLLLVHGAAGLNEQMMAHARSFAAQGYGVLAVDLWGQRRVLNRPEEFAAMITTMLSDRRQWMSRLDAARHSLEQQPDIDPHAIGAVGYCFGGTSVLDYIRTGHRLQAAVSLHGGLNNVGNDWAVAPDDCRVLILSGVNDLMATQQDLGRIQQGLNDAGIRWEQTLYGQTRHAFTEPDNPHTPAFARYDLLADQRSWHSALGFLAAVLAPKPQVMTLADVE